MIAMKRFLLSFIFLTATVMFFSGMMALTAAPEKLGAQFLCEYAVERYKMGDMKDAIHEFNKLLLVDPGNEAARSYLRSPSIDKEIKYLQREIARKTAKLEELRKLITEGCSSGTSMSAEALCEYAQERYAQGYMEDAKHEFSKMLIVDPDNQVAKSFLDKPSLQKQIAYLEAYIASLNARLEKLSALLTSCQ